MEYTANPDVEGEIQKIYISHTLDKNIDVWKVQYKDGKDIILNLVNPYSLKFDCDRVAVQTAQGRLKKKHPKTTLCSLM